jgi:hypothetical protein
MRETRLEPNASARRKLQRQADGRGGKSGDRQCPCLERARAASSGSAISMCTASRSGSPPVHWPRNVRAPQRLRPSRGEMRRPRKNRHILFHRAKRATNGIFYARVSSKDQEREGFSIPAQLELLRSYNVGIDPFSCARGSVAPGEPPVLASSAGAKAPRSRDDRGQSHVDTITGI